MFVSEQLASPGAILPARGPRLILILLMAATTMLVAATVTHGVLRPALEARGIKPWRLRDTLASAPLVCLGSAGAGSGTALFALGVVPLETPLLAQSTSLGLGAAVLLVSALMLLLGVIALRKLH